MTTINSIASTKALSALNIMDVASDCILAVGDMMRDLRRANLNPTSEIWGMLSALQTRFIGMKESDAQPADDKADAPTFTVAYTPEGKVPTAPTFGNKVDDAPMANGITQRRNEFMVELASRKNMSRNGRKVKGTFEPGAKQFIGGDDYATVLDSLVHDGLIVEFKVGRGTFYRMPEKVTVDVQPAPLPPVEVTASTDEIPAGFGEEAPAPTPTPEAPPVKKERKPRKQKTTKDDAPPANENGPSADAIGAAFLILGKKVSALDTVKAKKAVKLMAELRGLLS
jgi:hypothetical protein